MAELFVTQNGSGAMDGSSRANAWALAGVNWASTTGDSLSAEGEFTAQFAPAGHSSVLGSELQIHFDTPGFPGNVHVATGNAFVSQAPTDRNNMHIFGLVALSDDAVNIRMDSGVGVSNRRFFGGTAKDAGTNNISFQTGNGHDADGIEFNGMD